MLNTHAHDLLQKSIPAKGGIIVELSTTLFFPHRVCADLMYFCLGLEKAYGASYYDNNVFNDFWCTAITDKICQPGKYVLCIA